MLSTLTNFLKDRQNRTDLRLFIPFAILILFAIPRYVGFLHVTINPTLNRVTTYQIFARPVTPSLIFDHIIMVSAGLVAIYFLIQKKKAIPVLAGLGILEIIFALFYPIILDVFALLILPSMVGILIYNTKRKVIKKPQSWKGLLYTTTAALFFFEAFILSVWIAYAFSPDTIKYSFLWHPVSLEYELVYVFGKISPVFAILIVYSFLLKPAHTSIIEYLKEKGKLIKEEFAPNIVFSPKVMLAVAVAISIIFAVYPYLPTINPQYTWASVDDFNYQRFLQEMKDQQTTADMVKQAFVISSGDRPLTLLAMHSFHVVTGLDLMSSVRFFPVLLGPGLVFAAYFFVKEGTKNKQLASYAALITVFSHQVTVGIYAGFFANWLGLIAMYLCLFMIHRFWEKPTLKNYLFVFGHSVLSFLLYIYVDVYLLSTILVFLAITAIKFRHDKSERKKILILSTIFAIYAAIFAIRILLGSTGLVDTIFAREDITISNREFYNRWLNFPYLMHLYLGGFFANSVLLAFAFVWTLYGKYENTFDRILLASLFVGAIPLVFGDEVLQSRIFYDMPIHIIAAIAIFRLLNRKDINPLFAKTAFCLVTVHFAVYALRVLSNLNPFGV